MTWSSTDLVLGAYALGSALVNGYFYATLYAAGPAELLWYCNMAFLILAAGFFLKKNELLSAVLISAVPAQAFWILGHLAQGLGGPSPGRFRWLGNAPWGAVFELNYHLAILPLAAWGVWRHGYSRKALAVMTALFVPLLLASRLWTPAKENINCMFFPCDMAYSRQVANFYGWDYSLGRIALIWSAGAVLHFIFLRIWRAGKA